MADTESKIRISAENRTKAAFDEIKRSMLDIEGASNTLRNTLGSLGVGLSLGGMAAFVKSGIDAADNLNKLSQRVGVAVESLSALEYAAKLSDVSVEELSVGLRQLAKNAADTQAGTGEAADAFRALGISVQGAGGHLKGTEQLLLEIATKFAGLEDGAGKTAIAMKIFGRAGAELIPLLNQGAAGFEATRREAERLGIILSTDTAQAAEKFNDDMTRLGTSATKLKFALAEGVLPALNRIASAMAEATRNGNAFDGVIAGIRTFFTGDDLHKANVEFTDLTSSLLELENEADRMRAGGAGKDFPPLIALEARIAETKKKIESLQHFRKQLEGTEDIFGGQVKPPPEVKKAAAPSLRKPETDQQFQAVLKQLEDESRKVQELTRYEEVLAAIEAGRYGKLSQVQKDRLLALAAEIDQTKDFAQTQKEADAAAEAASRKQAAAAIAEGERLNALTAKYVDMVDPIQKFRDQLLEVDQLQLKGLLSPDQAIEARFKIQLDIEDANDQLNGLKKDTKDTLDEMGQFAKQAANNMQDAFSSGLFDIMQGKFSGLEGSFKATIDHMVANALSAKLLKKLFGDMDKTGNLGGFVGETVVPFFAGLFKAGGGPVFSGNPYVVGEQGPELFVPSTSGSIIPNHRLGGASGSNIVVHQAIHVNGAPDNRSLMQMQAAAGAGLRHAAASIG